MKKRISKLDELVSAARAESPVVSFEESARRIAALEQNRRSAGVWAFLGKAFAFPRAAARGFVGALAGLWTRNAASNDANGLSSVALSFAFSFGRLRAATLAFLLLAAIFPALIHDVRFGAPFAQIQPSPLAESSLEQSLFAATPPFKVKATTNKITNKASKAAQKLHLAAHVAAQPNAESASFLETVAFSAQDSFSAASDSSFLNSSSLNSSLRSSAVSSFPESSSFARPFSLSASLASPYGGVAPHTTETERREASKRLDRAFSRASDIPQERQDDQTLWSRLSVEARISARADIRPNATEQGALSPLQNLSFALYYAVSERHAFGVEGGNEPFASASFTTVATNDDDPSFGSSSLTAQGTEPRVAERRLQRTLANRAWAGASYQYSAETLDILGGVQPCARLTIGGGELGGVGRALLGARFLPKERFSFILAGEGAAVASSLEGAWELTPRLGVTFGVSVKF